MIRHFNAIDYIRASEVGLENLFQISITDTNSSIFNFNYQITDLRISAFVYDININDDSLIVLWEFNRIFDQIYQNLFRPYMVNL
jgi:hypothetical protein